MKTIEHFDGMFFAVERRENGLPLAYSAKDVCLLDALVNSPGCPLGHTAIDFLCSLPDAERVSLCDAVAAVAAA